MKNSAGRILLAISCVLVGLAVTRANAAAVSSRELGPSITLISARGRGKVVDVTVFFKRPASQSNSAVVSTQVKVGNKSCIATRRATRCTVKNVPKGRTVKVLARERSRRGFTAWGSMVPFKVVAGQIWRPELTSTGSNPRLVPVEVTTTTPSVVSTTLPRDTTAPSNSQPLRFDISKAEALALSDSSATTASVQKLSAGSNLRVVDGGGGTRDAVVSGEATISRFFIAPNDKLYVVFASPANIGIVKCILAEVDRKSGAPICIETDGEFQFVPAGQSKNKFTTGTGFRNLINDFQFDELGAIYYLGTPGKAESFPSLKCCDTYFGSTPSVGSVVRRYLNGITTEFSVASFEPGKAIEPGWSTGKERDLMLRRSIFNFLVLPNGKVLIDQNLDHVQLRESGSICMFARLDLWNPDATYKPVVGLPTVLGGDIRDDCFFAFAASPLKDENFARRGEAFNFLKQVSESDILAGSYGRVFKINVSDASATEVEYSKATWCGGTLPHYLFDFQHYFCGDGTMWRGAWRTLSGEVFAIIGQDPNSAVLDKPENVTVGAKYGSGVLLRVWPSLAVTPLGFQLPTAALARIEAFLPILDSIVASGTNVDGERRTVLYNTGTKVVTELIPPSARLEVSHIAFSSQTNAVLFSAKRASDNATVVGSVDLATLSLRVSTFRGSISDLQGFSS